jgi:hypothetical protein
LKNTPVKEGDQTYPSDVAYQKSTQNKIQAALRQKNFSEAARLSSVAENRRVFEEDKRQREEARQRTNYYYTDAYREAQSQQRLESQLSALRRQARDRVTASLRQNAQLATVLGVSAEEFE